MALHLQRAGLGDRVRVYERHQDALAADGDRTAWLLAPNGMRVLARLGVSDTVLQTAQRIELTGQASAPSTRISYSVNPFEVCQRKLSDPQPAVAVWKHDVLRALREALEPGTVVYGQEVVRVQANEELEDDEQAAMKMDFADGETHGAGVVILADGLYGTATPKEPSHGVDTWVQGTSLWDASSRQGTLPYGPEQFVDVWGRGCRFAYMQMDGERVAWNAAVPADMLSLLSIESEGGKDLAEELARELRSKSFPSHVQQLLERTDHATATRAADVRGMRTWWSAQGRCIQLGDAVHACQPDAYQGASMALESSAMLTRALQVSSSLPQACMRYNSRRQRRTQLVANMSRAVGDLVRGSGYWTSALRDFAASFMPKVMKDEEAAIVIAHDIYKEQL